MHLLQADNTSFSSFLKLNFEVAFYPVHRTFSAVVYSGAWEKVIRRREGEEGKEPESGERALARRGEGPRV